MQIVSAPERMSFKRKYMAMYAGMFYLPPRLKHELVSMIEHGQIVNDKQAVEFVDNNGAWLS